MGGLLKNKTFSCVAGLPMVIVGCGTCALALPVSIVSGSSLVLHFDFDLVLAVWATLVDVVVCCFNNGHCGLPWSGARHMRQTCLRGQWVSAHQRKS